MEPNLDANNSTGDETATLLGYLSSRDVPCPLCGYNLRGLSVPRCPECGREVRLTIGLVEPRMGIWILTAAALLPASGLGVFLWLIWMVDYFRMPGWPVTPFEYLVAFFVGYLMAAVPASIALLVYRRRFLQLPENWQAILAAIAVTIDAAGIITCLANIR